MKRALEMEEGNIDEHKNYLQTEEEKRKRARQVRMAVEGPLIRLISKAEEVKVVVEPPAQPPAPVPMLVRPPSSTSVPTTMTYQYGYSYPGAPLPNIPNTAGSQQASLYANSAVPYYPYAVMHPPPSTASGSSATPSQPTFLYPSYPIPQAQVQPPLQAYTPQSGSYTASTLPPTPMVPPAPPPVPEERIETVAKNYVVHENDQDERVPRPQWKDTMAAMFGDHVYWDEVRVYAGKGRPMSAYFIHSFAHVRSLETTRFYTYITSLLT